MKGRQEARKKAVASIRGAPESNEGTETDLSSFLKTKVPPPKSGSFAKTRRTNENA
jgi:hypothetical protein